MWREALLILGLAAVGLAILYALIPIIFRPFWRLVFWPHYRIIVRGAEHIPRSGAAVVAGNHVSWVDGCLITIASPRTGWHMIASDYVSGPLFRHLVKPMHLISVASKGPHAHKAAIMAARNVLDEGKLFGIFPEAQLSRNGLPAPFLRGIEVILKGRPDVPVIPFAIEGMWGSIFSNSGGRFFKKWPQSWRRTVVVSFGPAVSPPVTAFAIRQAVREQSVNADRLLKIPPYAEMVDPNLPSLPGLTISMTDYEQGNVRQVGWKPGTVGQAAPGVALRVVDSQGIVLGPDTEGMLQVISTDILTWTDTDHRARIDRDGFVSLAPKEG